MEDTLTTYKITIIINSDADPSEILDQSIEAAQAIVEYCGGEADENEVCVALVREVEKA